MGAPRIPINVAEAVEAWMRSMVAGPEACGCARYGDGHSPDCEWVAAGKKEYFAGKRVEQTVRAWAASMKGKK
jgi:hypothetical protein